MRTTHLIAAITLVLSPAVPAAAQVLCPDGSYVGGGGSCQLCPDGSYVSGTRCVLAPDGSYVGR